MGFFRRKGKTGQVSGEATESRSRDGKPLPSMYVKYMELKGLADITPISAEVRGGNVVILDVKPLTRGSSDLMLQLKRAVDQLRAICYSVGGDIGQLGNQYVLLTPKNVKIFRAPQDEKVTSQPPSGG